MVEAGRAGGAGLRVFQQSRPGVLLHDVAPVMHVSMPPAQAQAQKQVQLGARPLGRRLGGVPAGGGRVARVGRRAGRGRVRLHAEHLQWESRPSGAQG